MPRRRVLLDVLAVLAVLGTAIANVAEEHVDDPLVIALWLVPGLLVCARHRFPIATLVTLLVLAVAGFVVAQGVEQPLPVGIGIDLATIVSGDDRRRSAVCVAATTVATVPLMIDGAGEPPLTDVLRGLGFLAIFVAVGEVTRAHRHTLRALSERAAAAELRATAEAERATAQERVRIARDLHDVVAHQITVINLNAGVAAAHLERRPARAREALASINTASGRVLTDISALLTALREPVTTVGADTAVPGLATIDRLVSSFTGAGLHVTVADSTDGARLEPAVDVVAYRVLQEGLTNAHRHGDDGTAEVTLDADDETLRIVVRNPVDDTSRRSGTGHGLLGLRERVATVRGHVLAERLGPTSTLEAHLPLRGPAGDA